MLAFAATMEKMERHGGCGVAAVGCVNGGRREGDECAVEMAAAAAMVGGREIRVRVS